MISVADSKYGNKGRLKHSGHKRKYIWFWNSDLLKEREKKKKEKETFIWD